MNIKMLLGSICCLAFVMPGSAYAGLITSAGSTTVQPAMKACSLAYRQAGHSDVQFIIAGGGSSKGVKTVGRGKVDIGRASRPIKDKEKKAYADLKVFKLATDGVAMVVNASNAISGLSSQQVKQLFQGELSNWKQLGGMDLDVQLVSLGMEHGTYELFSKFFHLKGVESEGDIVFSQAKAWIAFSQDVALDRVAHDEAVITFASIGVAQAFAKASGSVRLIPLDGVAATEANVANATYRMTRPLLLLTNGEPVAEVKSFIDYALADECQAIVKKLGYIPVRHVNKVEE